MPLAPLRHPTARHALATLALAALSACADVASPVRRSVRAAPMRALHVDSVVAPARVVAGDTLRVTLHGACHGREGYEISASRATHTIWVYDPPGRPSRAGCAPLVVGIATDAPPVANLPLAVPDSLALRVAVRRPRGDALVHVAHVVLSDAARAARDSMVDRFRAAGNVWTCPTTPASASCSTPSPPPAWSSPPR